MTFKDKVLQIVRDIPEGNVMTYKEVANLAGNNKASRVVGNIMKNNNDINIPCHRVIRSDGKVGDYNGIRNGMKGKKSKFKLLEKEGVIIMI